MEITPSYLRGRITRFRSVCVLAVAFVLAAVFVSGCTNNANDLNGPFAGSGQTETTSIYGRILDESGAPLSGVKVSAGSVSATTDVNGLYIIKNAVVPKGRAVIIAKKAGYFDGARAETPGSKGSTRMELSMMSNAATYTVSSANGGKVDITGSNGASVKFTAGSFLHTDGTPYTGTVRVAARYLDPANSNFYRFFSGDQEAQRTDNSRTFLVSCGVLRVELTGTSGETIKLDPTKPATLTCPKPNDPKAPSEIQLWSFDESLGLWKEEGKATLQGNIYTGTVTHFTDYNFDYCGVENGTLTFRIVCNGIPIEGVVATVLGRQVASGADGVISIRRVAADGRQVTVDVIAADNNGAFFTNGAVTVTVLPNITNDAGDISLASDCPAALFGTLGDCGDSKIDGIVMVSWGSGNIKYGYSIDSKFAIQCPPNVDLKLDAIDGNGNLGTTVDIPKLSSGEQRTIGVIKICGTNGLSFSDITLDKESKGQMLAISSDGSRLAATGYETPSIIIYNTKDGSVVSTISISANTYIYNMQFDGDGNRLMASTYNGTSVYDVSTATATLVTTLVQAVNGTAIDDKGERVLATISHGWQNPLTVGVFSAIDGSLLSELHPTNMGDSSGTFGFIRDEDAIVYWDVSGANMFRVWSIANDKEVRTFSATGNGYGFGISEEGITIASTTNYKDFTVYDSKTGSQKQTFSTPGTQGTRNGSILVTKSKAYSSESLNGANVVRVVDLTNATSTFKILPNASYVADMAASRDEATLAASAGKVIRIWKLK